MPQSSRRGRPPTYTPAEDAIIMATIGLGADDTNESLVKAGYKPRTAGSLKARRHYLRSQESASRHNTEADVPTLMRERERIEAQVSSLADLHAAAQTALADIEHRLSKALDTLKADLAS